MSGLYRLTATFTTTSSIKKASHTASNAVVVSVKKYTSSSLLLLLPSPTAQARSRSTSTSTTTTIMMSSSTMKSLSASASGSGSGSTSTTPPSTNIRHHSRQQQKPSYIFDPPPIPSLPVIFPHTQQQASSTTQEDENTQSNQYYFPIHRIYCVGRNYKEHIEEMGDIKFVNTTNERTPPVFFTKPVFGGVVVTERSAAAAASPTTDKKKNNSKRISEVKYPPATKNLHYEVELVVAIGKDAIEEEKQPIKQPVVVDNDDSANVSSSRFYIDPKDAPSYIFGFGVGVDLTRRDIQSKSKKSGQPWDTAKYFDQSTPLSPISSVVVGFENDNADAGSSSYVNDILHRLQSSSSSSSSKEEDTTNGGKQQTPPPPPPPEAEAATMTMTIQLSVNGQIKQHAPLSTMIWNVEEIISELSKYYQLRRGDLILTGTPSGVGPLSVGDHVVGRIIILDAKQEKEQEKKEGDVPGRFHIEPVEFVVVE